MDNDEIKIELEEMDLDQSVVEDISSKVTKKDKPSLSPEQIKMLQENDLKNKMDNETDWRKRASLAARIISLNLD